MKKHIENLNIVTEHKYFVLNIVLITLTFILNLQLFIISIIYFKYI